MPLLYSNDFRLSVVRYYQQNIFSIKSAINIFLVSKSSIYNWIKLYNNNNKILPIPNIRKIYNSYWSYKRIYSKLYFKTFI